MTFVGKNKSPETAPPDWYAEEIFLGAEGFLYDSYIFKVQQQIEALKSAINKWRKVKMSTFTAQILIGPKHSYVGGIINITHSRFSNHGRFHGGLCKIQEPKVRILRRTIT